MSLIIPGQNGNISANTDVAANTAARHAAVTVTDSSEIDFTLTGQNITANLIDGSIGATRLSAGVNTSLGLANTALQPSTIGVTVQGYSAILAGITTQKITNWDTTYGWGNHASAGYLLSSTAASTYQPLDADLTAIAALAGTSGLLRKTAADTWSLDAATYLQSGAIGSTVLAYDANLQAFVTAFTLPTADGTVGQVLRTDGAGNITFVSPATGTVTSVGLSVPTGFAVSGSPVTGSGTLALAFDTGYSLPTTASQTNWNTAFGWGNHATAGYLLASTASTIYQPLDGDLTAIGGLIGTAGLLRKTAANTWTLDTTAYGTGTVTSVGLAVPTGFSVSGSPVTGSGDLTLGFAAGYALPTTAKQANWDTAFGWGNHASAGYLTTFTESDPVFGASPAAGITTQKITNWDTAYGWGNHATAGYLALAGGTMTGNLNLPSLNGGQLAGMRNKIINGKMEIAQRGTSFAAANGYTVDRWGYFTNTTAVLTASQQGEAPANGEFQYSLRAAVTTADASIAAGDLALLYQRIEGFNIRDLVGKTFTLSFWVRSSKTGVHCVAFRNNLIATPDRSYVVEYTVAAANTWEQKILTITGGLTSAGTWNYTNGPGIGVDFVLAAGSTFQTTAGAWQTGNFIATANQVNVLDTVGNTFAITGVQLEAGSVNTPFEHRPFGAELALCQRYYWRTAIAAGGVAGGAGTALRVCFSYPQVMRAAPTITYVSGGSASDGFSIYPVTGIFTTGPNEAAANVEFTITGTSSNGRGIAAYSVTLAATIEL